MIHFIQRSTVLIGALLALVLSVAFTSAEGAIGGHSSTITPSTTLVFVGNAAQNPPRRTPTPNPDGSFPTDTNPPLQDPPRNPPTGGDVLSVSGGPGGTGTGTGGSWGGAFLSFINKLFSDPAKGRGK